MSSKKIVESCEDYKRSLNILVVEDDALALPQIVDILSRRYQNVYSANNGVVGLEMYNSLGADIIVSDIQMPQMNGIDMITKIKEKSPNIPVVIMSAFSDTDYLIKAIRLGVDNYVLKPVDPVLLTSSLDKCAARLYMESIKEHEANLHLREAIIGSKSALIRDVAHHWRNPLSVISLYVQMIDDELDDCFEKGMGLDEIKSAIKPKIAKVLSESQKLSKIINEFNSMFESLQGENIYLENALNRAVDIAETLCSEANIRFEHKIEGMLQCSGDYGRLKIVVYQLVKNSIESIESSGRSDGVVSFRAYMSDGRLNIEVADNGTGVPGSVFDNICDPYISTKVQPHGQGLGLFMAHQMIEADFGGSLEWENLSVGAKFVIHIPIKF